MTLARVHSLSKDLWALGWSALMIHSGAVPADRGRLMPEMSVSNPRFLPGAVPMEPCGQRADFVSHLSFYALI
jgi:hypothetical protein